MPTELKDLELFEVSLVDAGDDPLAKVTLFKRKGKSDMTDEVTKTKEDVEKELSDALQEIETLKAQLAEKEVTEKAKQEETIEIGGETFVKSAIPAAVLKQLEDVQKDKDDLLKAAAKADLEKRATEKFPTMKGTPDQKGKLLKAVEGDTELMEILVAAEALFASMTKELGDTENVNKGMKDAKEELEDLIKQKREVNKNMTYEQAYAAVAKTPQGVALINKTYKKD
jgi:hypothetical protein